MFEDTKLIKIGIAEYDEARKMQLVRVAGEMDSASLNEIRSELIDFAKQFKGEYLVFDFANLKFLNSDAVSFLLQLKEELSAKGANLMIISASAYVLDVLKTIGFLDLVESFKDLEDLTNKIEQ